MRVAFISTILGFPWGSPDRLWTDLAKRCQARGDQLFIGVSALTASHPSIQHLREKGAELFIRHQHSIFQGKWDSISRHLPWKQELYLESSLARFNPDVVFITQGATYDMLAEHHLVTWLRSKTIPSLVVCHCNKNDTQLTECDAATIRNFFTFAAHVFFVSKHNLHLAERHLGYPLPHASVIQNPLAINTTSAVPFAAHGGEPIIGTVGRLDCDHKGLDLLLNAVASLPTGSLRLVLTGQNADPERLASLIQINKLANVVEIRGPLAPDKVQLAFGELELFLLTSRYEGCASSMLEAMMCGRPVLATDVGGVSDWIDDGVEGFIAPKQTSACIRETLVRALAERRRWPSMGMAARARFDRQRVSDPVATLLEIIETSGVHKT